MTFWDTSAVVPMLVQEDRTAAALAALQRDREIAVWWGTPVECASAIARLEREGAPVAKVSEAFARLDDLAASWIEVEPHDDVRTVARRLLRVHPVRAVEALQLAAAFVLAEQRPPTLDILTLDDRVRLAALKEGFRVPEL